MLAYIDTPAATHTNPEKTLLIVTKDLSGNSFGNFIAAITLRRALLASIGLSIDRFAGCGHANRETCGQDAEHEIWIRRFLNQGALRDQSLGRESLS